MSTGITEEQRLLQENLRRYLVEENEFEARRRRLLSDPPERLALWPSLAEMGVVGAAFEEAHGGYGGDAQSMALIMSELGSALAVEPYLASAVMAGRLLQRTHSPSASSMIEAVIAGELVCVLAHDAGPDPFAKPTAVATACAGGYVLNGSVYAVRHADVAQRFLVTAECGGAVALFDLPRDAEQLSVATYRLIDGAGGGDLNFRDVHAPAASRFAFDHDGYGDAAPALHDALEWGLVGLAAETAGIVTAVNQATFSYLKTRKQFGSPLASFQALQHRAADMHIAAEEILAMVGEAVAALERPPGAARSAAIRAAKVIADTRGRHIGHESVQLHGGMGVSDELNISHYARRLVAIRAELGSADVHRLACRSLH